MHICAILVILLSLIYPLTTTYTCPEISQFYVDCSNLYTLNESITFCSQHGMNLLNLTDLATILSLNQTLQLINCTNNFWYANGNQTGLVGTTGSSVGGVVCSIVPLLGLVCTSPPILQAATICTRISQVDIQQKCSNNESNQRFDLQEFVFTRQTTYASVFNTFQCRNEFYCNSLCSRSNLCIGTNYKQNNCTLYM